MKCGAKIELTMEKCSSCGTSLEGLSSAELPKKSDQEVQKKKEINITKIPSASPSKRSLLAVSCG